MFEISILQVVTLFEVVLGRKSLENFPGQRKSHFHSLFSADVLGREALKIFSTFASEIGTQATAQRQVQIK